MLRVYIGFDDTDTLDADRGTGKLARWFERELPEGCRLWGVVRQQLLVHEAIPYTSHNSSACVIVDIPESSLLEELTSRAVRHLERYALEGSDPGLCVACEEDPGLARLIAFSQTCTHRVVTQKDALRASGGLHLSGHGGSRDGIIGAAAAVGLTAYGWSGRFIEYGGLRNLPNELTVATLERLNILVTSLDRDGRVPAPTDRVDTRNWLRPRLWGQKPVLPLIPKGNGLWESLGGKRSKDNTEEALSRAS